LPSACSAPHSHRPPEDLDRQQQDRHRDHGHRGEAQVQLGHRNRHEQERAGGADEGQQSLQEKDLKGGRVRPGPEDDVPRLGAVMIAKRKALEPAEDVIADPPQAAEPHADREVRVSGACGGVDQMEPQRRRDDRGQQGGLAPGLRPLRQPSRVRLAPEDAVDQQRQGPGLEQVEPDAEKQQAQAQGYPASVRPEVPQRTEQLAETYDGGAQVARQLGGTHGDNLRGEASHVPRASG
jgi:hypothetical protein